MLIETKHFGEIDVDEERILYFEEGLPGFDSIRKFVLIDSSDAESPFKWLQSVDNPQLAFVIANPFMICRDYDFELEDDTVEALQIKDSRDMLVFSIVVVPEDITRMSMNLKAPIIINTANNRGMQIVLDTSKYGVRHYILEELRRQEVTVNACPDQKEGPVDNSK